MAKRPNKKKGDGFSRLASSDDTDLDWPGASDVGADDRIPGYDTYSCLAQVTWGWIWPLVKLGNTRQLHPNDLPPLPRFMQV